MARRARGAAHRGHGGHGHGGRNRYGNPADLARVIRRQLAPGRARWQKPAAVLRRLRVGRGQVIAEIGSGPGFWTLRLARAAGPRGRVFAVDPEPVMLDALRRRLERAGVRNVTQVLGRADDPGLPPGSCDLILAVNTYHHFADGPAFLRRLATLLRPRGRLVNIDFARRETPVGPPVDHRVAREDFLAAARRAGLRLVAEHRFLPHQYFLVLRPRR